MTDRDFVMKLLELGVMAYQKNRRGYVEPSSEVSLAEVGAATLATWLEELGRLRLIGDVQPRFTSQGSSFAYQVTEDAVRLWNDPSRLYECLDRIIPAPPPAYDLFISYATGDSALAAELKESLEEKGFHCFMAEKDIPVAAIWEGRIHAALLGSKRILLLLTPRSVNRPWVLMEVGAAWALKKDLIPALVQVSTGDLVEPIRKYQARVIETSAERNNLIQELLRTY